MHPHLEFKDELTKLIAESPASLDFVIKSTSRLLFLYELSDNEHFTISDAFEDFISDLIAINQDDDFSKTDFIDSFKDYIKTNIQIRKFPKKFSHLFRNHIFLKTPLFFSVECIQSRHSENYFVLGAIYPNKPLDNNVKQKLKKDESIGINQRGKENLRTSFLSDELNYQVEYKDLLMRIASRFINVDLKKVDQLIMDSLAELGQFLNVDRIYIVDYDFLNWSACLAYEWCNKGIQTHIHLLKEVSLDHAKIFLDHHINGEVLFIADVSELDDVNTRTILQSQDIKSLLGIPMMYQGKTLGFIGVDFVINHQLYTDYEQELLELFADIMVNLKLRANSIKELEKVQIFLQQSHELSGIGGWIFDSSTGKLEFDTVAQDILGNTIGSTVDIYGLKNFIPDRVFEIISNPVPNDNLKVADSWDTIIDIEQSPMEIKWIRSKGDILQLNGNIILLGSFQDISSVKVDKEKLSFQSSILHHINEAVLGVNNFGKIVYCNQAAERLFGVSESIIQGVHCFEFFPKIFGDSQSALIIQSLKDKNTFHTVISYHTSENSLKHLSTNIIKVEDKINQFYGGFVTFRDISVEKEVQDQLIESELKFRTFVESNDDLIFTTDINGIVQYMSPNLSKYSMIPVKEVVGNSFTMVLNERQRALYHEKLLKTVHAQSSHSFEFQYQSDFDYTFKWHLATLIPLLDEFGVVYEVLGIAKDISELKIKEVALQTSEKEAQHLAYSYKHILNNQSVYIIKTDKFGHFLYANDYYFKTFGREAVLNRANALNSITDEGQEKARQIAIKALKQPNESHEIILKKAKGDRIIGSKWEFRAVTNENGEIDEILCVGYDITSELESLEQAKRYIEVISNQNERLKSFAHIVSHDIRSHSANIISLIDFLKEAEGPEDENLYMEMLQLSSTKLDQTIKDLNEILSINEEHRKPQKLVNLYDAIEKVRLSLIGSLMKNQVVLHNDVDQNIWLDAVPSYVDSILINIISNGVKYCSPDRNSFIQVTTSTEGNKYVIKFEDNGLGIDLQLYGDKVFEMYKTFHGNEDSRGFGLYITRNQVEAMGGRISVDSKVDIGSTFKIELFDGVLVK
jgi:PAS domain S-box-containing protein